MYRRKQTYFCEIQKYIHTHIYMYIYTHTHIYMYIHIPPSIDIIPVILIAQLANCSYCFGELLIFIFWQSSLEKGQFHCDLPVSQR